MDSQVVLREENVEHMHIIVATTSLGICSSFKLHVVHLSSFLHERDHACT